MIESKSAVLDGEDLPFLSRECLDPLNCQQAIMFSDVWVRLIEYLKEKGKNPKKKKGYSESSVRPIARRIFQAYEYRWKDRITLELTPAHANEFITDLNDGLIVTRTGDEYSEGSKRKFNDALKAYFRFIGLEWEPKIAFAEAEPEMDSDPFSLDEREQLVKASMEYRTPPSYKNVSPEERDRWNTQLAQQLGKPKERIGPQQWKELSRSWRVPSLISSALDLGMRAALVNRLKTERIDFGAGHIIIPSHISVKNNRKWTNELSRRSISMLQKWLEQRDNKPKYDTSDYIWLNREGNPYNSSTLNNLLRNLIDEAGIPARNRKLTWHSIRHSTGMYVYDEKQDLKMVAEVLRQKSLESAKRYAHPTPESKKDVIESIQRGGWS